MGIGLLRDAKIVLGGLGLDSQYNRMVNSIRLLSDGSLDTSYNHTELTYTYIPGGLTTYVNCAGMQPHDGKMIVAGTAADLIAVRYDLNGAPDTSFNPNGIFHYPTGTPYAIAFQADRKVLLAGGNDTDFFLIRIDTNGKLDAPFGTQGQIRTNVLAAEDRIRALALQPNNQMVVAGYGEDVSFGYSKGIIARYLPDATNLITKPENSSDGILVSPNLAR